MPETGPVPVTAGTRHKAYRELLMNFVLDLVWIRARARYFRPLVTNFYLTKQCNLRCRYCYPPGPEPSIDTDLLLGILEKIRPHNPVINFTGGEPTLHEGLGALLKRARELDFYPILLSTNGLSFHRLQPHLRYVDHLIVSLDSLEESINDSLSGVRGTTRLIVKNITACAHSAQTQGFHMSLHSVITPENLTSIEPILHFCDSLGLSLSVSPEHGRFYPNRRLGGNPHYVRLIDRLTDLKRQGKPLACSFRYLQVIRNFTPHQCYPFVSPRVEPDGRVYFPCQRIAERHVYLQDYPSLVALMRKEAEWIADDDCPQRCFLACYVDVEAHLHHPLSIGKELLLRDWLMGRRNGHRTREQRIDRNADV